MSIMNPWRTGKPNFLLAKTRRRSDESRGVGPILAVLAVVFLILWIWSRFQ